MVCSTDRRIWKCPCKLSFKKHFFLLFFFSAANLTLKGAIFTEQRNRWYSHGKWHSDDEILTEKQTLPGVKETKKKVQNQTQHLPHSH